MGGNEDTTTSSSPADRVAYIPPSGDQDQRNWQAVWADLKHTFTTRDGFIGDYDYLYLFTPNIWPLNRKYRDHVPPFFYPDDKIPLMLILLLGLQHALTMISGIVSPILAVAAGAFHFDAEITQYLVSAGFITSGIATFLQVTRSKLSNTPYYLGTGLLSVVGPTFDIIPITIRYTAPLYARGICPVSPDGTKLPCPEAYGKLLGSLLCCVWVQFLVSFIPPKTLNRVFPKIVTGCLLLLCGIYLVSTSAESWGGGANCMDPTSGFYKLCPDVEAPKPLPWGDPKLIGLGFSVFATIIFVEIIGSPLMKSASIIFGLAIGSIISGATGYWSAAEIHEAPAATFLWTHTFKLRVDGGLILPLMIMFICEAMTCMPSILATAEMSGVEIEGTKFNTRIQGGILCDALGSFISALGTGLPMVSHAGNNGIIVLTSVAVSTQLLRPWEYSSLLNNAEPSSGLLCQHCDNSDGRVRQVRCRLRKHAAGKCFSRLHWSTEADGWLRASLEACRHFCTEQLPLLDCVCYPSSRGRAAIASFYLQLSALDCSTSSHRCGSARS